MYYTRLNFLYEDFTQCTSLLIAAFMLTIVLTAILKISQFPKDTPQVSTLIKTYSILAVYINSQTGEKSYEVCWYANYIFPLFNKFGK